MCHFSSFLFDQRRKKAVCSETSVSDITSSFDAFNNTICPFHSQVSYQGLDTENQRLQKALENSSRKIQQLEAELQEVETENQTLQRSLEELKISSKRLEQLEQEVREIRQFVMSSLRRC